MKDDDHFIEMLKQMRIAPMPADLKARLAEEPRTGRRGPRSSLFWAPGLAAAACVCFLISRSPSDPPSFEDPSIVNLLQYDTTLISSETIEITEDEGHFHEVVEREWRDELSARSLGSPLAADAVVVRRERVRVPIHFL